MNIEKILKNHEGTVVDVRSRGEFISGHVKNSVNIPLQEITSRMDEIRNMPQPLVLCCASGNRSGQAERFLSAQGIQCVNGGSWMDVNYYAA